MSARFDAAVALIDHFNADDPERPKELLYSRRMAETLERFQPDASEALKLAVRAQHIGRWKIPRADYPMDRPGYQRWPTALAQFHADTAGNILTEAGYAPGPVERTQSLILKKQFKSNAEAQTLEDVACLVFLEHYFADFADEHTDEKLIRIIQRTWLKMSEKGHEAALRLEFPGRLGRLVQQALNA